MSEGFPTESRSSDAHTFSWEGKEYDTYKLIECGKDIKPIKVEVDDFEDEFDQLCWTDATGRKFKPRELLESFRELGSWDEVDITHPEWGGHVRKMRAADYSYPILVHKYLVIDGTHRLLRAYIDEVSDIYVRIIDVLPQEAQYNSQT